MLNTVDDKANINDVLKENDGKFVYKITPVKYNGILKEGKLPSNGVVIKTIVTTEGARAIANYYGVEIMDVLTGFKYIGEKIREFQETGDKKYLFGFEESYGYLAGEFVRDKDAVIAAMLIAEMTLYYKEQGKSLYEALIELYNRIGFFREDLISIELQGKEGQEVPEMTDEVVAGITARYIELYEGITGEKLVLDASAEDLTARIENNVKSYLNN